VNASLATHSSDLDTSLSHRRPLATFLFVVYQIIVHSTVRRGRQNEPADVQVLLPRRPNDKSIFVHVWKASRIIPGSSKAHSKRFISWHRVAQQEQQQELAEDET
jgi:hypothetical protein